MTNKEFSIVDLISAPDNVLKIIYTACRTCYSAETPIEIFNSLDGCQYMTEFNRNYCDEGCIGFGTELCEQDKKQLKLISKILESGHHSTIEHCQFVFSISGVSRACTHQLVRHRHMSFSQQSQRYVSDWDMEFITPESIKNNSEALELYKDFLGKIPNLYHILVDHYGITAEDARFILPNAATSSMIASLNLRELIHLANLRLCNNAQWEIRKVVKKMCELAIEKEPWLAEYLVPKCVKDGKCKEIKPCGRVE